MFDCFIGVDWSGAQKEFHKGIQVAVAKAGECTVSIKCNQNHPRGTGRWSRKAVMDYIMQRARDERMLVGFDFAFAHPYPYFPLVKADHTLGNPESLWQLVDDQNEGQPYLYGGGIWKQKFYGEYYNRPKSKGGVGKRFSSRRRLTEWTAATVRSPSPTFNCVGPASVGTGSLAGMRMLHKLNAKSGAETAIWPFGMPDAKTQLTIVEIFPALYFAMAGIKDKARKETPLDALKRGLEHFNSVSAGRAVDSLPDNDDLDAMISAAAMRHIVGVAGGIPSIPEPDLPWARREGWIFGAGRGRTAP